MKNKKCVIDVGHSERRPGAFNHALQVGEWDFNHALAQVLDALAPYQTQIVYRESGILQLCKDINAAKPDFVLSLHLNSFSNEQASGTECLYWHASDKSKRCAEILQERLVEALGLPDRGIKPRTKSDRGGTQLMKVAAPIVIVEPFFLSSIGDYRRAKEERYHLLVDALLMGVDQILKDVV